MNQEIKQRWIGALRSGEYTQGAGVLRRGEKYCCLGVLCELALADGIVSRSKNTLTGSHKYGAPDSEFGEVGLPPGVVATWAELSSCNPSVDINSIEDDLMEHELTDINKVFSVQNSLVVQLSTLNDVGVSFDTIARIIELAL